MNIWVLYEIKKNLPRQRGEGVVRRRKRCRSCASRRCKSTSSFASWPVIAILHSFPLLLFVLLLLLLLFGRFVAESALSIGWTL